MSLCRAVLPFICTTVEGVAYLFNATAQGTQFGRKLNESFSIEIFQRASVDRPHK